MLEKCVQRIARSDFDDIALDKELAPEAVILWFAAAETMSSKSGLGEDSGGYDNRLVLMKVFKAMASLHLLTWSLILQFNTAFAGPKPG